MNVTYRPLGADWPGKRTPRFDRHRSQFKTAWNRTLTLLERELGHLEASQLVFQIDVREGEIRLDGMPRADARPTDPAVIVSFGSKHGPLRYFCDQFLDWQDNVRAIALGLEALRTVDRYGITKKGQQYAGWKALGAGTGIDENVVLQFASPREAAAWILEKALAANGVGAVGTKAIDIMLADKPYRDDKFRQATKKVHPDVGGARADWDTLVEARRIIESSVGGNEQ